MQASCEDQKATGLQATSLDKTTPMWRKQSELYLKYERLEGLAPSKALRNTGQRPQRDAHAQSPSVPHLFSS
jgi:hypothetical protein